MEVLRVDINEKTRSSRSFRLSFLSNLNPESKTNRMAEKVTCLLKLVLKFALKSFPNPFRSSVKSIFHIENSSDKVI